MKKKGKILVFTSPFSGVKFVFRTFFLVRYSTLAEWMKVLSDFHHLHHLLMKSSLQSGRKVEVIISFL